MFRRILLTTTLALACAQARAEYSQLVVFGDSLSDVGNNGRYTDGLLWDEHLAGGYGLKLTASKTGGTDYAYSGALITSNRNGIPGLPVQVTTYLTAHAKADPNALYILAGGTNDVLSTVNNPTAAESLTSAGVADTISMLQRLYAAGARHFIVSTVARTDYLPLESTDSSTVRAQQKLMVQTWNANLVAGLKVLAIPGAGMHIFDLAEYMQAVETDPHAYGFTVKYCDLNCTNLDHTWFYDTVHPRSTAHAQIAVGMLTAASQP